MTTLDHDSTTPKQSPENLLLQRASGEDCLSHLTPEDYQEIARELNALRKEVMNSLGEKDKQYLYNVLLAARLLDQAGQALILTGALQEGNRLRKTILNSGTLMLALSKIMDNMELGHNILHGQWDWVGDPKVSSKTFEWNFASPARTWRKTHNQHHAWTNVIGKDNDVGYNDYVRVTEKQSYLWNHSLNLVLNAALALIFDVAIAAYDTEYVDYLKGDKSREDFLRDLRLTGKKMAKMVVREYGMPMLLAGALGDRKAALRVGGGVLAANVLRNVWAHTIIFCGHFPEGTKFFREDEVEQEGKGGWYVRQMVSSANISGGVWLDFLSGHLSRQIEHHLYPNMPSHRLRQVAPRVRALAEKYNLPYNEGSLPKQVRSVWRMLVIHSAPPLVAL